MDTVETPMRRTFVYICAFLLAVAFISGITGSMNGSLSTFAGLILLLVFFLGYFPVKSGKKSLVLNLAAALAFAAAAALVLTHNRSAALLGLAALVAGLDAALRIAHSPRKELAPVLLTVVLWLLFLTVVDHAPFFWLALNRSAVLFASGVGHLTGREINLGITYSGTYLTVLFSLFFLAWFALAGGKSFKPIAVPCFFLALVAADALYIFAHDLLAGSSLPRHLELAQPFISPNDFRLLLFAFLAVPAFFLTRSVHPREVRLRPGARELKFLLPALLLLIPAVAMITVHPAGSGNSKGIVFYDTGHLDWNMPDFDRPGLRNSGMYGLLPRYLDAKGYAVRMEDALSDESLDGASTLVLINLPSNLDGQAEEAIWRFVDGGGSLLVLGDHTGREYIRDPFNSLLARVGIAFNFDAAIPLRDRWVEGLELKPHPVFAGIDEDEIQVNVGASLTASSSSEPLIIGAYGFSDSGDEGAAENGYLGNMSYSRDEQLGDVILAADAYFGQGRVLVFGDTSSFQNQAVPRGYRFIDNVFAWLGTAGGGGITSLYPVLLVLALLAASVLLLIAGTHSISASMIFAAVLASVLLVSSAVSTPPAVSHAGVEGAAVIDVSHLERCSLDPLSDDSLDALDVNLLRNGYFPLMAPEPWSGDLAGTELLTIVAPAKPFSPSEIRSIKEFVDRGGLLLLTTGFEQYEGSRSLFETFDLGVGGTPLGRVTAESVRADSVENPSGVVMWEAWPVTSSLESETEVLARAGDYPVIVFRRYGAGGVIAAGDSSFLLVKNLEGLDDYNIGNITFLKECFARFKEGRLGRQ